MSGVYEELCKRLGEQPHTNPAAREVHLHALQVQEERADYDRAMSIARAKLPEIQRAATEIVGISAIHGNTYEAYEDIVKVIARLLDIPEPMIETLL